jgi:hypothetical protein
MHGYIFCMETRKIIEQLYKVCYRQFTPPPHSAFCRRVCRHIDSQTFLTASPPSLSFFCPPPPLLPLWSHPIQISLPTFPSPLPSPFRGRKSGKAGIPGFYAVPHCCYQGSYQRYSQQIEGGGGGVGSSLPQQKSQWWKERKYHIFCPIFKELGRNICIVILGKGKIWFIFCCWFEPESKIYLELLQ